jgi:hypothetical protein
MQQVMLPDIREQHSQREVSDHSFIQCLGPPLQVPETDIDAVQQLPHLDTLPEPQLPALKALLSKTVVLKLNGGLGTSMVRRHGK